MKTRLTSISAVLLLAAFLSSCAGNKTVALSAADRAALQGKTVVTTRRDRPTFMVQKPEMALAGAGGAIGGLIAGGIGASMGNTQIERHNIADPAVEISDRSLKSLTKRSGAKPLPAPFNLVKSDKPKDIAAAYPSANYVLDVKTLGWGTQHYGASFTKYFVSYAAQMRLIESASGRVVAQSTHVYSSSDKDKAPDYDGVFSNGAAFLRQELKTGSDEAAGHFEEQL